MGKKRGGIGKGKRRGRGKGRGRGGKEERKGKGEGRGIEWEVGGRGKKGEHFEWRQGSYLNACGTGCSQCPY